MFEKKYPHDETVNQQQSILSKNQMKIQDFFQKHSPLVYEKNDLAETPLQPKKNSKR